MKLIFVTLLTLLTVISLVGCGHRSNTTPPPTEDPPVRLLRLKGKNYIATSYTLENSRERRFKSVQSLNFKEDGTVNGTAGCNHFFGRYQTGYQEVDKLNTLHFNDLMSTQMACRFLCEEALFFEILTNAMHVKEINSSHIDIISSTKQSPSGPNRITVLHLQLVNSSN